MYKRLVFRYLNPTIIQARGCGWGGFAKYAAEKHGAEVVGITVSREQVKYARNACAGLPVEIRLQDYRDIDGRFDHIVSVGMLEHEATSSIEITWRLRIAA